MFLKKSTDNCAVGIVVKTYLLFIGFLLKNELFFILLIKFSSGPIKKFSSGPIKKLLKNFAITCSQ